MKPDALDSEEEYIIDPDFRLLTDEDFVVDTKQWPFVEVSCARGDPSRPFDYR